MTGASAGASRPWDVAWSEALYGPDGFYRRPEGPAGHFRTASHAAPALLAQAIGRLAEWGGCLQIVDVGAGRGELLSALAGITSGFTLIGVDVAPRPEGLPDRVQWLDSPPEVMRDTLLIGWELLDVVPCPVLELDDDGLLRQVHVDPAGNETLCDPAGPADLDWAGRWWPLIDDEPGQRVEVGRTRTRAWLDLAGRLRSGVALAVDYDHLREDRPPFGSLTGYAQGRQVAPVPDGSCDITAHVALDAVAAELARRRPERTQTLLLRQRDALKTLGIDGSLPSLEQARDDPAGYARSLERASRASELLDPYGLGGFGWLMHGVGPGGDVAIARLKGQTRPG